MSRSPADRTQPKSYRRNKKGAKWSAGVAEWTRGGGTFSPPPSSRRTPFPKAKNPTPIAAMEAGGCDGGPMTYGQVEQLFNSFEGPTAQERIDCIVPFLVSLLPPPFVPVPDAAGDDSDDDRFSLTSSDSEDSDIGAADPAAFHPAALGDGQDHISRLPDALLSNIISRLATREAARTVVLSTRWRGVWAATPLLVDDAHLVDGPFDIPIVRSLSRCVAAHPGPVRAVRVTSVSFYAHEYALQRLVKDLADKGVQDLILLNRPWPLNMPLPDDILRCASLERLYLGVRQFPEITAPRLPVFDKLRELGLFHCVVSDEEVDALLAHCPKLEVFSIVMTYGGPSRLHIMSRSLRVAVDWNCMLDEVVVKDAPCLERLILNTIDETERRPVKIVCAPRLKLLGFLDLNLHTLEIGGVAIKAGINVRARAMVPSLKILAVIVQFACSQEAKMLPTLLKCFPHLETLHVLPIPSESPNSVHDLEFWESLGPCECLESHLKMLVVHGCLVQTNEIGFLQYIIREGKALKAVGLSPSPENKVAFDLVTAIFCESNAASDGGGSASVPLTKISGRWNFQNSIDMSLDDPFFVDDVQLPSF
ncbi:hypothetical protein U9M48_018549 [Paspalum notatum var. saurae]|uniref:F-box domain-containing protein n=1 Tax=Paspalum notatum var. saurae TaxID=547442 RepID=A0AAQ3WQE6_PASNO